MSGLIPLGAAAAYTFSSFTEACACLPRSPFAPEEAVSAFENSDPSFTMARQLESIFPVPFGIVVVVVVVVVAFVEVDCDGVFADVLLELPQPARSEERRVG